MRTETHRRNRLEGSSRENPRGFTLVEVMVAALLLVFAMAGIVPFFLSALNQSTVVRYKSTATNIARERMEQIRQLDYREITDSAYLSTRFGSTETQREMVFDVSYGVEESAYDSGVLKKVTVTVGWTAPPKVSAAAFSTMIHQQFVGPRVSQLDLDKSKADPLGTPFRCLYENQQHTLYASVAQADWGLVLENLDEPGMVVRDAYARISLVDVNGTSLPLGDAFEDYKITDLVYTTDPITGKVNQVYFQHSFDSADIPDGYWEFRAIVFNEYDEPGNVWRLRTRVENGPPAVPTAAVAVPEVGDEGVTLYWSGGAERDRAYYVVERRKWDWTGSLWGDWVPVRPWLDPDETNLLDEGSATQPLDPWGDAATQNLYQYRIWAVDIIGKIGSETVAEVGLPNTASTTTTLLTTTTSSSTTTTEAGLSMVKIENKVNKEYSLFIECDDPSVYPISTNVQKRTTKPIENLPTGNYLVTATSPGRPTLKQSFCLTEQSGQIVMTIL
jgi:prepilin-type N-terminal cleavage/methylation domain-containing protein